MTGAEAYTEARVLLDVQRQIHARRLGEMYTAERALVFALRRAQRARRRLSAAGGVLVRALRLVAAEEETRAEVQW